MFCSTTYIGLILLLVTQSLLFSLLAEDGTTGRLLGTRWLVRLDLGLSVLLVLLRSRSLVLADLRSSICLTLDREEGIE